RGGDTDCGDDGYLSVHEVCCQSGQAVELTLSERGLDCDVLALHNVNFLESLPDRVDNFHLSSGSGYKEPDNRYCGPLRARRERPRGRCAADKRDERAALHSITSSAVASSLSGTVRPSIRAIWALMTNSNLVDCTTGRSAGLAPLRIRPVKTPSCRYASVRLAP